MLFSNDYFDNENDYTMYLLGVENVYGSYLRFYIYFDYNLPIDFNLIIPIENNNSDN